ncbi:MAG TPA: sigma-70 family RNA polymerase sigma factor [Anaerolineales bacterium]|nr:sigma-70 family RNA polymerase sigma factor [Anaerolineales bacterium]
MGQGNQANDEAALAVRAARERIAFVMLYDRYFPRVYNYLRARTGDPHLADDLTAQTFEHVLRNIAAYRPEKAPFSSWLFAIARNALNDHLRVVRRRQLLSLEALRYQPADRPDMEEHFIQNESRQALARALEQLGERERDLVALKFIVGLNNRQIASLSGLSESNVGVILYRAMHRLRALLHGPDLAGMEDQRYERA